MVYRRVGTYGLGAVLLLFVAMLVLFASSVWAQGRQEQPVSEAQKDKIERLSDAQAEEQFVRAAQTSQAAGDLEGENATAEDDADVGTEVDRIVIPGLENCDVDENATITFRETGGDEEFAIVSNGEGAIIDPRTNRIVVTGDPEGSNIIFAEGDVNPGPLEVVSSSGIDCGDPDDDDGFDDELLLLLLLELLEDNDDGNNGNGDNNNDDFDEDNNQYEDENGGDLDGDGDVDQEDELFEAENELDGEDTDGDTFGDEGDEGGPVSANAEDGLAEASTPGAVASAGGDPDNLEPLTSTPEDVVDEIPTSGPLPNTGGMPILYWFAPLAGLLLLAGLPVYRWAKRLG